MQSRESIKLIESQLADSQLKDIILFEDLSFPDSMESITDDTQSEWFKKVYSKISFLPYF